MRASEHSQSSQASSSSSRYQNSQSLQTSSQVSSAIRLDSPELTSTRRSPSPILRATPTHEYPAPDAKVYVTGVTFDVDFNHVYVQGSRLQPSRLGYAVKHKASLSGGRALSNVWAHGLQLQYTELDGSISGVWLCKLCHQARTKSDAKYTINGTSYIRSHIKKKHAVNPFTGKQVPSNPNNLPKSPFTHAAHIPGMVSHTLHTPWEEEQFQHSVVDWTIIRDLSFLNAIYPATRGLLTWNRLNLLHALPDSATTLSSYINKYFTERQLEVRQLIQSAASKIAVSVDIWTSSNHLSFLGVVAHFVDADYQQRDLLIAFNNLIGDHTASAQALAILKVILSDNSKYR